MWFVLLPMSLFTLYLIFEQGFSIRSSRLLKKNNAAELTASIEQIGPDNPGREIFRRKDLVGIAIADAVAKSRGDFIRMRTAAMESLQEQATHLLRKIEWLNLLGGVSPMVGLFGTVFGMIKLFNALVLSGAQPAPSQLAEGISVALVTTFWGLIIAIPALAAHGIFRNKIEGLIGDAVIEVEDILPLIRKTMQQKELAAVKFSDARQTKTQIKTISTSPTEKNESSVHNNSK